MTREDAEVKDIWAMLEETAPDGCDGVQNLYSWSLNHDAGKGPFCLFLDLIGWSEEEYGDPIFSLKDVSSKLGYTELGYLTAALDEYVSNPSNVRAYVDALMTAELES